MSTVYQGNPANVTNAATATVNGATNATPIVISTSAAHGFQTGDLVDVTGVGGNTAANNNPNNPWSIIVIDSTHFSLTGSVGNGAYTSGGTATDRFLTPATTLPSDGDARSAASADVPLETGLDRVQFLAQRVGAYRLLNRYATRVLDDTFTQYATMTPSSSPVGPNVSGATNASPIVITTASAHGFTTGDTIQIASVGGNMAANGTWIITVLSTTTFSLGGSTGNGAYTSGGTTAKNWVTMTGMSGLLAFAGLSNPPVCNTNDIFDITFSTTATFTNPQGICLSFEVAGGNYQPIAGSAIKGAGTAVQLTLRGLVVVGDTDQPLNSGTNNQTFNFGVSLVTNAGSPQSVSLLGYRELVVNHYRAN